MYFQYFKYVFIIKIYCAFEESYSFYVYFNFDKFYI